MKMVMLRHATRAAHGLGDAALNAVGLAQAVDLVTRVAPIGSLPNPTELISSPKRRARETLQPLAETHHLDLVIDKRLDERKHSESVSDFEARVKSFINEITERAGAGTVFLQPDRETCVYVVSHLDWLETALLLLPSDLRDKDINMSWATLEYKVFRFQNGIWMSKDAGFVPVR